MNYSFYTCIGSSIVIFFPHWSRYAKYCSRQRPSSPFISAASLFAFLPSGSLMYVEQFEVCHLCCSSACLSLSLSVACALSCCKSAAVSVFRPERRVRKWRMIFPFQFTLLNGCFTRYTYLTPLINGVIEMHFQYTGWHAENWCVIMVKLLMAILLAFVNLIPIHPTHAIMTLYLDSTALYQELASLPVLHLYSRQAVSCACLSVSTSDLRWCRSPSECVSECGASGCTVQTIVADTLSTLTAMSPAQKNYQCCCGTLMETSKCFICTGEIDTKMYLFTSPLLYCVSVD